MCIHNVFSATAAESIALQCNAMTAVGADNNCSLSPQADTDNCSMVD